MIWIHYLVIIIVIIVYSIYILKGVWHVTVRWSLLTLDLRFVIINRGLHKL